MYNEAFKRKMKNKEKSMRLNNDKNISEIYEINYHLTQSLYDFHPKA